VSPLTLALARAERRLLARLEELDARLDADDATAWPEYRETAATLATIARQARESGALLTTGELADKLGVSSKTILRRAKRGELKPALRAAARGSGALRWRAP
jgi:hypothetical protein